MLWQVKKDRPLPCIPVMPLAGELFLLSFHCLPFQNAHGLGFDILFSEAAAQGVEFGNNPGLAILFLIQALDRLFHLISAVDLPFVFAL